MSNTQVHSNIGSNSSMKDKEKGIPIQIDPSKLKPYEVTLKENIRNFHLLNSSVKIEPYKLDKILNESSDLSANLTLELNFKFTCDYESIENDIKAVLNLFGEINTFNYDNNTNSLKIKFKNSSVISSALYSKCIFILMPPVLSVGECNCFSKQI